jgi:hypothetical protein
VHTNRDHGSPTPAIALPLTLFSAQVLGQIRALGTKQHLKSKFGSAYMITIKYPHQNQSRFKPKEEGELATPEAIRQFITSLFPSTKFISDNGGLMTFSIPSHEIRIAVAFSEIEANKSRFLIEDYSIAQSTLEQVFIRTVQAHTPSAPDGGRERTQSLETLTESPDEIFGVYSDSLNSFGCTMKFTKYSSSLCGGIFLLLVILAIILEVWVLLAYAIICLIGFLVCCVLYSCPCCQPPKDEE